MVVLVKSHETTFLAWQRIDLCCEASCVLTFYEFIHILSDFPAQQELPAGKPVQ